MSWLKEDMFEVTRECKLANPTFSGTVSGTAYHDITMFYNQPVIVDSSAWAANSAGCMTLAENLSAKHVMYPLTGLKEGDQITKFRVLGGVLAPSTSATTTIDASLWKCTKTADSVAAATSCGAITQVAASEDAALDSEKDVTDLTVADDYQYFVLVKGTTANNTNCAAFITGVEADIYRIV